jgi:hypothetical protein
MLGLAGVGLGGAAPKRLPNHLFSLTVWAEGPKVDFVLLNIAEQTLQLVWPTPPAFDVLVRDEARNLLSNASPDGFVAMVPAPALDVREVRRRARRLVAWKAFKGSISTPDLYRLVREKLGEAVRPDGRYALTFRMRVPVVDPAGGFQMVTATARSLCTMSFDGRRQGMVCLGPQAVEEDQPI